MIVDGIAAESNGLGARLIAIGKAIQCELRRLNRAGLEPGVAKRLTWRQQVRAVKASIAEKHRRPTHCC